MSEFNLSDEIESYGNSTSGFMFLRPDKVKEFIKRLKGYSHTHKCKCGETYVKDGQRYTPLEEREFIELSMDDFNKLAGDKLR